MKLFESILWKLDKGYFLLDYHLERMERGAVHFGFHFREDAAVEKLKKLSEDMAAKGINACKIRMFLDTDGNISFDTEDLALRAPHGPLRLAVAGEIIHPEDSFIHFKTTNRDFYEHSTPRSRVEYDDLVFLNTRGELCETTRANIVLKKKGKFLTPSESSGLLPGTYRAYLLDKGEITEQTLYETDLLEADSVFLINSVRKWMDAVVVK